MKRSLTSFVFFLFVLTTLHAQTFNIVKNINQGTVASSPSNLTAINGVTYFAADDGVVGKELWKTDGTTAGTLLIKDIYAGTIGSNPNTFIEMNGIIYFQANSQPVTWNSGEQMVQQQEPL
jgi:ELWxxDGT repeat protein